MATWDDVYQAYQQASREDLIAASKEATLKVLNALIEKFGEDDAFIAYMAVIGTFICADNKVDYVEYEFFKEFTGLETSYDDFYEAIKRFNNKEYVEACDQIIDSLDQESKTYFITIGVAMAVANGTVSEGEKQLLSKYLM